MQIDNFKLYGLNSLAMMLSFADIESYFKIILLFVSIVYTIMKILELIKNKNGKNNN